jgi:hypothetical protein
MRFLGPIALSLIVGAAGCTAAPEDDGVAMGPLSGSFGVIQIERGGTPGLSELSGRRAVLNAFFARYRGMEGEHALELLGVARPGPQTDECEIVGGPPVTWPDSQAAVELLDAGRLEVRVAGSRAELRSRTFPELGTLVAGSFYAEDADLAEARADVDEYRVVATGGGRMEAFEAVLVGPPAPSGVVIDGFLASERPVVDRDRTLELLWDAGDPRDRLDIQLLAGGQILECIVRDTGVVRIPDHLVAELEPDDDARLILKRVRVQGFDAPGLDVAWADVTATSTVAFQVR